MITRGTLQVVAMVSMLVDHVGVVFFPEVGWLRVVGRLAFPIYAWLAAEGLRHSTDRERYIRRLLVLAWIAEFPHQAAMGMGAKPNVIFTLWGACVFASGIRWRTTNVWELVGATIAITFSDYGIFGAAVVGAFSAAERHTVNAWLAVVAVFLFGFAWMKGAPVGVHAIWALPLIGAYRDRVTWRVPPWLWRGFYAGHFVVLAALRLQFPDTVARCDERDTLVSVRQLAGVVGGRDMLCETRGRRSVEFLSRLPRCRWSCWPRSRRRRIRCRPSRTRSMSGRWSSTGSLLSRSPCSSGGW